MVKCLSTVRETRVQSLGWDDTLEKEMAIHSSILPGKSHGQRSLEGTKVIATFIMVDRKEKGQGEKGAMQEIEEQFGFPVYSVVDVYDIIEYLEEDPANEENVTRIKNYLAVNGAK